DTGDTGNTGNTGDTGNTGNTGNTGDTGDTAVECVGISIDTMALVEGYDSYEGSLTQPIGNESLEDVISFQFYTEDYSPVPELPAGTYDLGTGINTNFNSCSECVLIFEDEYAKTYFQQSGTLTITENKAGTIETKGTLTAKLVEVTIAEDFTSTPVAGGGCFEIEAGAWDIICIPDCEGKICGSDGCGGECGDGCEGDKQCNAEGTACADYECAAITLGASTIGTMNAEDGYWTYNVLYNPATGEAGLDDKVSLQLYAEVEAEDSFDLADTNYVDCEQCILVYEDMEFDETSGDLTAIGKVYFQQKGTLDFESFDAATGKIKASVTDLRLIEVTIDSEYASHPVQGGACLEVATGTVEVK
ncbi:MAG TPA: hypothetical protein PLT70_12015, partial [bacterium]|nr:hypothetical protein [bacterium]